MSRLQCMKEGSSQNMFDWTYNLKTSEKATIRLNSFPYSKGRANKSQWSGMRMISLKHWATSKPQSSLCTANGSTHFFTCTFHIRQFKRHTYFQTALLQPLSGIMFQTKKCTSRGNSWHVWKITFTCTGETQSVTRLPAGFYARVTSICSTCKVTKCMIHHCASAMKTSF